MGETLKKFVFRTKMFVSDFRLDFISKQTEINILSFSVRNFRYKIVDLRLNFETVNLRKLLDEKLDLFIQVWELCNCKRWRAISERMKSKLKK